MNTVKFVINLEARTDRRKDMERQLRLVGWSDVQFFKAIVPDDPAGFPSIGARGCFLSHLTVLRRADRRQVLLMEDDLNFVDGFSPKWIEAIAALPNDWSIFYPAHVLREDQHGLTELSAGQQVVCAHFMLINAGAVPMIASQLEAILSRAPGDPIGGPMHVDGAYSTIRRQNPGLRTFAFFPSLGYQRSSRSDITTSQLDRVPVFRQAVAFGRKIKNLTMG